MLHLLSSSASPSDAAVLRAMFEARKAVFVDLLKWDVPVIDGRFEVDQFDDEHARYLILADPDGRHLGSARLLPTSRPHILDSLYPMLCETDPPRGSTASRRRSCRPTATRFSSTSRNPMLISFAAASGDPDERFYALALARQLGLPLEIVRPNIAAVDLTLSLSCDLLLGRRVKGLDIARRNQSKILCRADVAHLASLRPIDVPAWREQVETLRTAQPTVLPDGKIPIKGKLSRVRRGLLDGIGIDPTNLGLVVHEQDGAFGDRNKGEDTDSMDRGRTQPGQNSLVRQGDMRHPSVSYGFVIARVQLCLIYYRKCRVGRSSDGSCNGILCS